MDRSGHMTQPHKVDQYHVTIQLARIYFIDRQHDINCHYGDWQFDIIDWIYSMQI